MNFPVGSVVSKGDVPLDFEDRAEGLERKKFNGYLILTISSNFVEEGAVFFRDGEIVACIAECLAADKTIKGREALDFFLNQTKGVGFFHCVELSRSQVDLVTAFDEKLLVGKLALKDLPKLIPGAFSERFERPRGQKDILESYGLKDLK